MMLTTFNLLENTDGRLKKNVPIVMILVEGGRASIKTVCEALESGTPVVIIRVR